VWQLSKPLPQWLKPERKQRIYLGAEAPTLKLEPQQVPLGRVGEPDSWVGMVWVVGTVYGVVPARLATHS